MVRSGAPRYWLFALRMFVRVFVSGGRGESIEGQGGGKRKRSTGYFFFFFPPLPLPFFPFLPDLNGPILCLTSMARHQA